MPGSLLTGYLRAQQYEQQQEGLAEEKKREKLEEALNQLRMKQLGREMERNVEIFKRTQAQWELTDEARARIQAGEGTELDRALMGLKMPEPKEPPYPWMGTPYEEAGARKEFHISPERETGGIGFGQVPSGMQWIVDETGQQKLVPKAQAGEDVLDITRAMQALYPTSGTFQQLGEPTTPADSLWKGLITEPRTGAEEPFFAGKKRLESVLREVRPEADITEQKKGQIDQWLDAGYSKEEIRATIEGEEDHLTKDGIDVQELYKYLGF